MFKGIVMLFCSLLWLAQGAEITLIAPLENDTVVQLKPAYKEYYALKQAERIKCFVLDLGFSRDDLEFLRNYLLEPAVEN